MSIGRGHVWSSSARGVGSPNGQTTITHADAAPSAEGFGPTGGAAPTYSQPVQGVAFPSPRLRARENDTRGGTLLAGGASALAGECAANSHNDNVG